MSNAAHSALGTRTMVIAETMAMINPAIPEITALIPRPMAEKTEP
jgi:hypothetical protein